MTHVSVPVVLCSNGGRDDDLLLLSPGRHLAGRVPASAIGRDTTDWFSRRLLPRETGCWNES